MEGSSDRNKALLTYGAGIRSPAENWTWATLVRDRRAPEHPKQINFTKLASYFHQGVCYTPYVDIPWNCDSWLADLFGTRHHWPWHFPVPQTIQRSRVGFPKYWGMFRHDFYTQYNHYLNIYLTFMFYFQHCVTPLTKTILQEMLVWKPECCLLWG